MALFPQGGNEVAVGWLMPPHKGPELGRVIHVNRVA
jgi:hypothetical protein